MADPKLKPVDATAKTVDDADPFADLSKLRLSQDFAATCGVKKLLTTVNIHKPSPQAFVRVHSDPAYRDMFPVITLKDDHEVYLVLPAMQEELGPECVPISIYTAITRQGTLFFWPVRLPRPEDKMNSWWSSAQEAAELAMGQWVRVKANMENKAYDIFAATGVLQDPVWPDLPFDGLVRIAFRNHSIGNVDHPVVKSLRGAR